MYFICLHAYKLENLFRLKGSGKGQKKQNKFLYNLPYVYDPVLYIFKYNFDAAGALDYRVSHNSDCDNNTKKI